MLGIVIGVSAVIAMVALGRGAQQSVKDRIASPRHHVDHGRARPVPWPGRRGVRNQRAVLTIDDAHSSSSKRATQVLAVQARSVALDERPVREQEHQHHYHRHDLELSRGAEVHDRRRSHVHPGRGRRGGAGSRCSGLKWCPILGITLPRRLIGETVRIGSLQFEVVGSWRQGAGGGFGNPDDQVLVPLETARYR
jgi:hypothetical protein